MIISTVTDHTNARPTFKLIGVDFEVSTDNLYNIAELNPEIVITDKDISKIGSQYPHIKFVGKNSTFPNYEYTPCEGFDSVSLLASPLRDADKKVMFLNTKGHASKLMVQKLKANFPHIHIYGIGFGINEIKIPITNTIDIYRQYEICGTDDWQETCKILAISKTCISPHEQLPKDKIMNYTFFDAFAKILKECDPTLAEKLIQKKEKLHEEN